MQTSLYDPSTDKSSCGVGFITRKDGVPSHDVFARAHEALCAVPHRGGMSAEGVGDGAGVHIDVSETFFRALTGRDDLVARGFAVGNFFRPADAHHAERAHRAIRAALDAEGFDVVTVRDVPVDDSVLRPAAVRHQMPVEQWVAVPRDGERGAGLDPRLHRAMLSIEAQAYTGAGIEGLYVLSLSARTQVLKGRLNSNEVLRYFVDLTDPRHEVRTLFFHTRFSTNTDPHPTMAQPFRFMAHNGELNTDRKNRIAEDALARARSRSIVVPPGQSDSSRFDQTLASRMLDDELDIVSAVVSVMPPAWENDRSLPDDVRAMLEYFSLYEEKNDGPAAVVFADGDVVGARLDRLGLRPLRTIETDEYLVVTSEAGQVAFAPETVLRRGRIEAGGMLYHDHRDGRTWSTRETLVELASRRDYPALLEQARVDLADVLGATGTLASERSTDAGTHDPAALRGYQRFVSWSFNTESFRYLLDPMLANGSERISAMGYGNAINALAGQEGGVARYFSQRFAQVTNPPLDSIREADGMTLRVALGAKPNAGARPARQIVLPTPVLTRGELDALLAQPEAPVRRFEATWVPCADDVANARSLEQAIDTLADEVGAFAAGTGGIAVLDDTRLTAERAPIPFALAISAVNQHLVERGLRLRASVVASTGQVSSSHHVAVALGFGAAAVHPVAVHERALDRYVADADAAFERFRKAAQKSLLKTMGRVGLCTVESYIGGEFFEPSYLDTSDPVLARYFPHLTTPVGGVGFEGLAASARDWHERSLAVVGEDDVPLLGLFKERADGAGHSYGTTAVRGFVDMTEQEPPVVEPRDEEDVDALRLLTLGELHDAFGLHDAPYPGTSYDALTPEQIDAARITPSYRDFVRTVHAERRQRPAALRDVLALPGDVSSCETPADFARALGRFAVDGNESVVLRGVTVEREGPGDFRLRLRPNDVTVDERQRHRALAGALRLVFGADVVSSAGDGDGITVRATGTAAAFLAMVREGADAVPLDEVQPASSITRALASGAMSHGALVASAHEAVAHGVNMAGGMSNCGEGGEHLSRYGTVRGSRIKQFASGRFGVWAGYLADPMLEEIEIKIGQGAKPGEGGQLPAPKVTVDIAAARGGTPGVELVSPPPHHDTYSIEDLAQLIHDAKAARVRVVVKLVSSEGIGTIAVGVAKAGADVINVAGNTGGTGAAAVTSLKYAGRSAEIGIAEVHQALSLNGLRDKVALRCSGAHQTGSDVVTSALLGGDSFEFGTTALMMLKCVMAKNCNVKCPAGITTNAEAFDGDPRTLARYLVNIAHEVRHVLASLGLRSLREARGRSDLLHLVRHPAIVARLDLRAMLARVDEVRVEDPVYLEKDFTHDDAFVDRLREVLVDGREEHVHLGAGAWLSNGDKSVGAQLSIDVERLLNHELTDDQAAELPAVLTDDRGRRYLAPGSVLVTTAGSAGQSYGAFLTDGIRMRHVGTCNDGVGKGLSGGTVVVESPGGGSGLRGENVLVGNFALFGATGGRLFVAGEAGDRFAVRNSGASAVVEGVGDFACEYMTNGAVLNLGGFGTGLGNGMSGGFVYQYDPERLLEGRASTDSVRVGRLDEPEVPFHEEAARRLLEWHVEATASPLGRRLLEQWDPADYAYGLPRALLLYQDAQEILAARTRKELVEELSQAVAAHLLRSYKLLARDGRPVLQGRVPEHGEPGARDVFALLNAFTVQHTAQDVARQRLGTAGAPAAADDPRVAAAARKLVLTEDFALRQRLARFAREAIEGYDDAGLAALVGDKRVRDYKDALRLRNVLSVDAPGTYGWILHQDARNRETLGRVPSLDELFAARSVPQVAREVVGR